MKKRVLLALLAVAVALVAILCFTVPGAAEGGSDVSLSIYGKSLALKDGVYINYYVKVEGADESLAKNVKMLFFTAAPGADGYTVGNPDGKSADHSGYDEGTGCYVVRYTDLTLKQMTDVIYSVAYLDTGDGIVYSAPCKYSIAQYAYNKAGDATEGALVKEMMELGGAAQKRFDYHTDDLASKQHYKVTLSGMTFEDGFDFGLYPAGATVTVTAPETVNGNPFVCWKNENDEKLSNSRICTVTVTGDTTLVASDEDADTPLPFDPESSFAYSISGEKVKITGYYGSSAVVRIPETIKGYPVTEIGTAFQGRSTIVSIVIPSSVTSITGYAFSNCSGLAAITIPSSVTSIGADAFNSCTSLNAVYITDLTAWCGISFVNNAATPLYYTKNLYLNGELVTDLVIPTGVTSIGSYAFYGCSSLTSITIPSSVTSIGGGAFYGCGITSITIPSSVESIGGSAFSGCPIQSATIPANAISCIEKSKLTTVKITNGTSINQNAFSYCSTLTSVEIPASVTSIGSYAFRDCSNLNAVYITDLAAWLEISFGNNYANPLYYANNLYLNGELVTDLVIPSGVESLGSITFQNCRGLTSVTIPSSVTSIGSSTFSGCSNLTSITLPSSLTNIGMYAFNGCPIQNATVPANAMGYIGKSNLTTVVINGGESIGNSAFRECSSLTSITIPSSVTSIGDYAFYDCDSLTSITIPSSVTSIGSSAFLNCTNLTIYCEAASQPTGWSSSWKPSYCPVVWGYTGED